MVEGSDILTYDKKDGWSTNGSEPLCHESASGWSNTFFYNKWSSPVDFKNGIWPHKNSNKSQFRIKEATGQPIFTLKMTIYSITSLHAVGSDHKKWPNSVKTFKERA